MELVSTTSAGELYKELKHYGIMKVYVYGYCSNNQGGATSSSLSQVDSHTLHCTTVNMKYTQSLP